MYSIFACWVGWSTRWEIKLREVGTSHPTIGTTHFWSKQMSLIPFVPLSADEYSKNYRNWNGSSLLTFCPSLGLQHCWPVFCQSYVEIICSELQAFLKKFSMERVIFSETPWYIYLEFAGNKMTRSIFANVWQLLRSGNQERVWGNIWCSSDPLTHHV